MPEPIMFRLEGTSFGKIERWGPYPTRDLAESEKREARKLFTSWDWVFAIVEVKTDA